MCVHVRVRVRACACVRARVCVRARMRVRMRVPGGTGFLPDIHEEGLHGGPLLIKERVGKHLHACQRDQGQGQDLHSQVNRAPEHI